MFQAWAVFSALRLLYAANSRLDDGFLWSRIFILLVFGIAVSAGLTWHHRKTEGIWVAALVVPLVTVNACDLARALLLR